MTENADPPGKRCSTGWRITGYYLPGEDEHHGPLERVDIPNVGQDTFPKDFLAAVKMEGWGLTRHGWYLGWTSGHWAKSEFPLNARGGKLKLGSLAVDPATISLGSEVLIPTAPAPWNTQVFIADDTGGGINGKHVDVYCGAGASAKQETFRVTSNNGKVCF